MYVQCITTECRGIINTIVVKLIEDHINPDKSLEGPYFWLIKTRPDNTVIVKESKKYSEEDLKKAFNAGTNYGCAVGEPDFEKWMKQNL